MITKTNSNHAGKPASFFGLSSDTKPTKGVANASTFYEMDTKKLYLFDKENSAWLAQ